LPDFAVSIGLFPLAKRRRFKLILEKSRSCLGHEKCILIDFERKETNSGNFFF
jgi:hypothetical protein